MNKKQKIVLLVTILLLILLCGGLSYAFFSSVSNNESSSTILAKGGKMTIKYANGSGTIKMQNIYPREEAWVNKVFTVTGNNTTDLEMNYRLYLVVNKNTFNFGDLTYSISGTSTNSTDTLISKANQPIPGVQDVIMGAGIFKSKTSTHSYNLRIFYKETGENQNNGQGKGFAGYVKIDSGSTLAYDALATVSYTGYHLNAKPSAFNGPITREEVETIVFNNTNTIPTNAINSWDVSDKQNGSVMAYTLDEDNDGLYEVYIGQNGGVVANPNSKNLFEYFSKLETLNLNNLDTSKVTDMSRMFYGSKATTLDLSNFNTSKVTNMSSMFDGSVATILDLTSFDTSNVTDMSDMFYGSKATTLDLSNFDTSKVTNMSSMFQESAATTLVLSSFDTSNVTNMKEMFYVSKATSLDLSSFDTSNVTGMSRMFCVSAVTEIKGLNQFNTSKVTDMSSMFYLSDATSLDLSSFDTSNVTDMSSMFRASDATEIKGLTQFNTSKVTNMSMMFYSSKATSLDLSSFDTSKVTNMSSMFRLSKATMGYARTQADADKFNATNKPSYLTFVVKS